MDLYGTYHLNGSAVSRGTWRDTHSGGTCNKDPYPTGGACNTDPCAIITDIYIYIYIYHRRYVQYRYTSHMRYTAAGVHPEQ